MAEAKAKTGIGKKVGPLPVWGYGAVGVGAFLVFRLLRSRKSSGTTIATPLSGGIGIPGGQAAGNVSGLPVFSSFSSWEQAAISAMAGGQLDPATALNGLTSWINGQCVTQNQYAGISSIIETVGLPPGFSSVPTLSVCAPPGATSGGGAGNGNPGTSASAPSTTSASAPSTTANPGGPPNLSQSLIAAMTANGEQLVGSPAWDSVANEWLYVTNRGGVYALAPGGAIGSQFYGSGLSPSLGGAFAGRTASGITANPNGGYTITDTAGENYTFGPGQHQNYAGATVQ